MLNFRPSMATESTGSSFDDLSAEVQAQDTANEPSTSIGTSRNTGAQNKKKINSKTAGASK